MKRISALILACIFALGTVAFASDFKDMPNDWSREALEAAASNGLLSGSNGYIMPYSNMTRAEMAAIMVRACGAVKEADISAYTDVASDAWYYASMARAVEMGAFTGSDNKLNPESPITRQEAFLVLSRVFGLSAARSIDTSVVDSFKDGAEVSDWAKTGVAAVISSGFVTGADGYINPLDNITRAEFAVVMGRLIECYIDDAAAQIPTDKNVMIRVAGISLDGIETSKMIVLGDGIGSEAVSIKNARLTNGALVIRGGGEIAASGSFKSIYALGSGVKLSVDPEQAEHIHLGNGSSLVIPVIIGE